MGVHGRGRGRLEEKEGREEEEVGRLADGARLAVREREGVGLGTGNGSERRNGSEKLGLGLERL